MSERWNGTDERRASWIAPDIARELGGLQARMATLEDNSVEQRKCLASIKQTLDQAKGGWKLMIIVAGLAGSMGALLTKLVPFIPVR